MNEDHYHGVDAAPFVPTGPTKTVGYVEMDLSTGKIVDSALNAPVSDPQPLTAEELAEWNFTLKGYPDTVLTQIRRFIATIRDRDRELAEARAAIVALAGVTTTHIKGRNGESDYYRCHCGMEEYPSKKPFPHRSNCPVVIHAGTIAKAKEAI